MTKVLVTTGGIYGIRCQASAVENAIPRYAALKSNKLKKLNQTWYSPKYQSKHTYPEVFKWFEEEGLKNIKSMEAQVSVKGQK